MGLLLSHALSILILLFYSSLLSSTFTNCSPSVQPIRECHEDESNALLQFKEGFVISKFASLNPFSYPKTTSWMPTVDCCSWDGIQCDDLTSHVIAIDLSSSHLYGSINVNSNLFSLVHLQSLDISDNDFNGSQIPARFSEFSQLRYLNLSQFGENTFSGEVPLEFSHFSNLLFLDLCSYANVPTFPDDLVNHLWLNISTLRNLIQNSTKLEVLCLSFVTISSSVLDMLTNLTSLKKLSLANCELYGEFPSSLGNLNQLEHLDLSYNSLQGQVELDMFLKLKMLTFLELSYSNLSLLPLKSSSNVTLPPIQVLGLNSCNLSGEIPSWIMNLTSLNILTLQRNKLQGEIPHSLFKLENLTFLSLAMNFLEGQIELGMFLKFKMLTNLRLSGNKLSLFERKGSFNATIPPLKGVELDSCNLVEFPAFLQDLDELAFLNMRDNDLKSLPSWIWEKRSLQALYVSNSSLTGEISPLICNLKSLVLLDLSDNNLSGTIPSCLGSFSQSLQALVVRGNKLSGNIPQTYMIGTALKMIDFSDNNLQGQLPRALVNCRMLEFIDVSHNQINDSFPFWLGSLPELKVMGLRYNEFHGAINCPSVCIFPKLHILDLSHNKFSGHLSSQVLKNWKTMTTYNISQLKYEASAIYFNAAVWLSGISYSYTMSSKGVVTNYERLQKKFYFMVAIDLSSNRISGEIPDMMGDFESLASLNLSNNMLVGNIPASLGKLSNLEALDLSLNSLSGNIPQELTELTFLEFFNVSFNKLSGHVPENNQFSTFEGNSFKGNQGLCGIQLLNKCEGDAKPPPLVFDGDQDSESFVEFDWKVILIGYGGGIVAGLTLGSAFSSDVLEWLKGIF